MNRESRRRVRRMIQRSLPPSARVVLTKRALQEATRPPGTGFALKEADDAGVLALLREMGREP